MRPERTFKQRVRVHPFIQDAERNEYNDPIEGHGDPVEYRGRLQQTNAREVTIGRTTEISDWLLMIEGRAVINAKALVVDEDDHEFEVLGAPSKERDIGGRVTHIEANLRLIEE